MTLKARVIPCLDVKDGRVVKGVNFVDLIDAGDPVEAAKWYVLSRRAGLKDPGLEDFYLGLNEEQQAFAGRFLQFQDDMDEKFFGRAGEINDGNSSDVKETTTKP